jgi:hypothetical protein
LAFNVCLLVLALATAAAFLLIARDHLYTYAYSPAGARVVASRIERLNGALIPLEFDRQRQWDDLIANELMSHDVAAARGFLLSARGMLPADDAAQLNRHIPPNANDAQIELAAMDMLTPGTRARYETTVPLLSRRGSGAAPGVEQDAASLLGSQQDFEAIARAIISDPESDSTQFIVTGFRLGLAGQFTPRMAEGAAVLLAAMRRQDYPQAFGAQMASLIGASLRVPAFRDAAMAHATGDAAGSFSNSAPSFIAAVDPARAAAAKAVLDRIGAMSTAASRGGATALLTHATSLHDMSRLLLIAEAGGDRAAAAAKRLPRDGRLLGAARGDLMMTRDLIIAIAIAAIAFAGALFAACFVLSHIIMRVVRRFRDEDYSGELVDVTDPVRGF